MLNLDQIKEAVRKLSPVELINFQEWFENFLADHWDAQLEADAIAGKFDHLGKAALEDYANGDCIELPFKHD